MKKKNILFVSTGAYAFGESVLALNFAKQLDPKLYHPCFLVSPNNSVLLASYPQFQASELIKDLPQANHLLLVGLLEEFPPDLIVLCDFLTFHYSQPMFGITLEMLKACGAPIISLDSYEWESGDFQMDYFNGISKQAPEIMREIDGGLRPCPLNRPRGLVPRAACYSFLHQINGDDHPSPDHTIREELEIPREAVVFVSAEALWQKIRPKKYGGRFGDLVENMMSLYIHRLGRELHWVQISPTNRNEVIRENGVTEHRLAPLSEPSFNRLLASSDLLISTNVVATTLAKCVRYGVNALFLQNSVFAAEPGDLERHGIKASDSMLSLLSDAYPLRPYLMYPLGYYKFISPMLPGNPFLDTFFQAEILEDEAVLSILDRAADRSLPCLERQRTAYLEQLASLPTPGECLEHFM